MFYEALETPFVRYHILEDDMGIFDKEPCTYVTRMTGTYMYAIIIVTIIV